MTTAKDLVGAWRLLTWEIAYSDGRPPSHPFGADAEGLLMYTPDGFMSVAIARAGRREISGDSPRRAPPIERAEAFDGYFTYAGRYRVSGGQVTHVVETALNPSFVGAELVRRIRRDGAVMKLVAEDELPGTAAVKRTHTLAWEPAKG